MDKKTNPTKWVIDTKLLDEIAGPPHSETTQDTTGKSGSLMHNVTTSAQGDHTSETTVDASKKGPVCSFL